MKTAVSALLVCAFLAGLFGLFRWRAWATERLGKNEHEVHNPLIFLARLERAFHADDADKNGVENDWTADIAGLGAAASPREAALLAEIVAADPAGNDGRPYRGYRFIAMEEDDNGAPLGPKHRTRYGFCAYPADYDLSGRNTHIVTDERVTRRDLKGAPVRRRPSELELRNVWPICIGG